MTARNESEEFELRSLDKEMDSTATGPEAPAIHQFGRLSASPAENLFFGDDPGTLAAAAAFASVAPQAEGFPYGDVVFDEVYILGHWGLVVDRKHGIIWYGEALGWAIGSVKLEVTANLGGQFFENGSVLLPSSLFDDAARESRLHLLAQPGFNIYGHWLVDVVPRLHRAMVDGMPSDVSFLVPTVRPWGERLVDLFGFDLSTATTALLGKAVFAERLQVLTHPKHGRILDRRRLSESWSFLGSALAARGVRPDVDSFGPRLFVSRAQWPAGRTLVNHDQVAEVLRSMNYSVIHPQKHSLAAQCAIFANATHVVGEDGSGLHNIIFADSSAHLTVLDLDRTNVFHSSVANVSQQAVSHVSGAEVSGGWETPVERLIANIEAVRSDSADPGRSPMTPTEVSSAPRRQAGRSFSPREPEYPPQHPRRTATLPLGSPPNALRESTMAEPSSAPAQAVSQYFANDGIPYSHFMKSVRDHFAVKSYFEIGTFAGGSLTFVDCATVAVDPEFRLEHEVVGKKPATMLFQMTSDDFFAEYDPKALLRGPIEMAFLDGMHMKEYLLRDFINIEKHMKPNGVVFLHDCLPGNFQMTARRQRDAGGKGWTGDVWQVVPILQKYRPDLQIHLLNCPPTGLVMITGLDPESRVLEDSYFSILKEFPDSGNDEKELAEFFEGSEHLDSRKYFQFDEISKLLWL